MALRARSGVSLVAPPVKDKDDLYDELKQKTNLLASVQRNYEAMSRLMQEKSADLEKARYELQAEQATVRSLCTKLEDAVAAQRKAEANVLEMPGLLTQLKDLKQQADKQRFDSNLTQGQLDAASDRVARLQKQVQEGEQRNRTLRREAEAKARECDVKANELRQLHQELEAANSDRRALESETRALRDQYSRSESHAAAVEQRRDALERLAEALSQQLSGSKDQIKDMNSQLLLARDAREAAEVQLDSSRQQCTVLENQLRSVTKSLQLSEDARATLTADVAQLKTLLGASEAEVTAAQQQYLKLDKHAKTVEQQYNNAASSSLQASDLLRDLQKRLENTRSQLEDARNGSRVADQAHSQQVAHLKGKVESLEARCSQLVQLKGQAAEDMAAKAGSCLDTAEKLAGRLQQLSDRTDEALLLAQQQCEQAMQEVMGQLLAWLSTCTTTEGQVAALGPLVASLEKSLQLAWQAAAERSGSDGAGGGRGPFQDTEVLMAEVVQLRDELQVERRARATAMEDIARVKAACSQELSQAAAAGKQWAEQTLTSERGRHAAHLSEVKSELASLKISWNADRAAASKLLQMEKEMRQQALARMQQEMVDAKNAADTVASNARNEVEDLNKRTSALIADIDRRLTGEVTVRQRVEAELGICRSNLEVCYNVGKAMLADMMAMSNHMYKMGVHIPTDASGSSTLPDVENGTGSPSVRLATSTRLQFSYITEAVQNLLRDLPRLVGQRSHQTSGDGGGGLLNASSWLA